MVNIHFRGIYVFKSSFSIKLSLKRAKVEFSQKKKFMYDKPIFPKKIKFHRFNTYMTINKKIADSTHIGIKLKLIWCPIQWNVIIYILNSSNYCEKLKSGILANLLRKALI